MLNAAMLIEAFFVTWVVGLTPALIARYWWKKAPLSNRLATSIAAVSCVIFAFGFMFLRLIAGGEEGLSPAWMVVFFVSRAIMMRRRSLPQLAGRLQEIIADPATTEEQRSVAREKLEALTARIAEKRPSVLANSVPAGTVLRTGLPSESEARDGRLDRQAAVAHPHNGITSSAPTSPENAERDLQAPLAALGASHQPIPTDDDPSDQFSTAALSAISIFADHQFAALAARVQSNLRRQWATGIYGEDHGLRTLWDEACFETLNGPTAGLEHAWNEAFDPYITERITALEHPTAVLLTIAVEYATDDIRHQNGRQRNDQVLGERLRAELSRLAHQDCDGLAIG